MNETYIEALRRTAADLSSLSKMLSRSAVLLEENEGYNPRSHLLKSVGIAEASTVRLRHLAASTGSPDKDRLYAAIIDALGIEIREYPDWIRITVPAILPMRSRNYASEFMVAPLRQALMEYLTAHPGKRYRDCVICVVHQYDESLGLPLYREDDGIEMKRIMDVIEKMLLTNDSGLLCTVLHCVELGTADDMRIYLMTPEALLIWLEHRNKESSQNSEVPGR